MPGLQGTYDAGFFADGVLSTEHENGVAHVHQLLFAALCDPVLNPGCFGRFGACSRQGAAGYASPR